MNSPVLRQLEVELGTRSYPIQIGPGLLATADWPRHIRGRHVLVISDSNVAPLYLDRVLQRLPDHEVTTRILPPGEPEKNLGRFRQALEDLAALKASRDATVVALGGGVVGDLSGFVAACWMRGIAFIQLPTSLLAMVDSSVGGKTAVDLAQGKNLVGAFHQPAAVIADLSTLDSLPERELAAGLAEVVKYGALGDADFFAWLEEHAEALLNREAGVLAEAIERSCRHKAAIVARDETERGERALLNLGHSFGHALETADAYGAILHGEAVAIGMVLAAKLSAALGMADVADGERLARLLHKLNLPVDLPPGSDPQRLLELMRLDKKNVSGRLRLILWRGLGQACIVPDVDAKAVHAALVAAAGADAAAPVPTAVGTVYSPEPRPGSALAAPAANDRFLRALRCEPVDCTPVWIMRQAGRYLPEYRATRARAGSFLALAKTPELACEVTLQPLRRFALDAAILFSDILTIPDAMGLGLYFAEGEGPKFERPVRSAAEIDRLAVPDIEQELGYVTDAVRLIRRELDNHVPLIGFSGSPWTLACYMIEGGSGAGIFPRTKTLLHEDPAALHRLLDVLTDAVIAYLDAQRQAGAQALQVFDSWGGILAPDEYREFSLRYLQRIAAELPRPDRTPLILFGRGNAPFLEELAATGTEAIGVDWLVSLAEARRRVGPGIALQGNLDPSILLTSPERIRAGVKKVLDSHGPGFGHVFNLGHGITPQVPPEHLKAAVDAVHEFSRRNS